MGYIERIVVSFGILIICLTVGFFLKRAKVFGPTAHETLNQFIIWISVPALTYVQLQKATFEPSFLLAIATPWLVFVAARVCFTGFRRFFAPASQGRDTIAALTLVCGLSNTSFLGFPMLESLIGPEALPPAMMLDQLGSFLVLSTLGFVLAARASAGRAGAGEVLSRVLRFPPFWATVAAFATRGMTLPPGVTEMGERLGSTLSPLALVSVGSQITLSRELFDDGRATLIGLGFKLLVAPLLVLGVALLIGLERGLVFRVTVLENSMAPMITGGIIAAQFGLRPELSARLLAIGIVVSFLTVPLWNLLLTRL